jgi:glycosyltransferase involved in cell wall biosynthesis
MPITKLLFINAFGHIGGDTAMLLLGLQFLASDQFKAYAVTTPRGDTYHHLKTIPDVEIIEMELGGKEFAPRRRFAGIRRAIETAAATIRIVNLVNKEDISVIYSSDRTVAMGISYAVSRITGRPLVVNAQISHYLEKSALHRAVVKHASRITVSSEHMRSKFLRYVQTPEKLFKISNAIKINKYDPNISGEKLREEIGIGPDVPVVTLVGRLNPFKGQREFIRAAELILKERPNTFFLLAGGEDVENYELQLKQLIKKLGVGDRVKLIGYRSDMPEIFAGSTMIAMPSYEEPFGLVALEAMAMCKPVVATCAGGVPEYFLDGEVGILIPPRDHHALANAILELLDDPERAREMGLRGRKHIAANYNERVYSSQIAHVLSNYTCPELHFIHSLGEEIH